MSTVKKALAFSFLGTYVNMALLLISTMVLSRILSPEDYGLFTIAYVFVLLAEIIREFGVNSYIIKEKELSDEKLGSAFTILLIIASLIAPILFFSADFISQIYGEPKLEFMLQLLSLNILIAPFGSVIRSILIRNLNFKDLTISELSSQVISIVLMIYLAVNGTGELTLIYGSIVRTLTEAILLHLFRPKEYKIIPRFTFIKEVFHYSKYIGIASFINQLGENINELIVGKFYSMDTVGQLNRASNTSQLFNQLVSRAISPVISPFISKISRDQDNISKELILISNVQLNLAWPFFLILGTQSELVVNILFGDQWNEAANYLQIYCIYRFLLSFVQHLDPILLGIGRTKPIMVAEIFHSIFTILVVTTCIQFGVTTMLLVYSIVVPTFRISFYLVLLKRILHIEIYQYIKSAFLPLISGLVTSTPMIIMSIMIEHPLDHIFYLLISILASITIWIAFSWNQLFGILIRKSFNLPINIKK